LSLSKWPAIILLLTHAQQCGHFYCGEEFPVEIFHVVDGTAASISFLELDSELTFLRFFVFPLAYAFIVFYMLALYRFYSTRTLEVYECLDKDRRRIVHRTTRFGAPGPIPHRLIEQTLNVIDTKAEAKRRAEILADLWNIEIKDKEQVAQEGYAAIVRGVAEDDSVYREKMEKLERGEVPALHKDLVEFFRKRFEQRKTFENLVSMLGSVGYFSSEKERKLLKETLPKLNHRLML
jgi:hypothetical protein